MLSFVLNYLPHVFYLSKRALPLHSSSTPAGQNTLYHRATDTESGCSTNLPATEQRRARSDVPAAWPPGTLLQATPRPAHSSSSSSSGVGALQRPVCGAAGGKAVRRGQGARSAQRPDRGTAGDNLAGKHSTHFLMASYTIFSTCFLKAYQKLH